MTSFSYWFSGISDVKAWICKYSQHRGFFTANYSIFNGFPSWRLALFALHKVHRSCECLKNKSFTPGTYEFQQETRFVWRGEYFFREIINKRIYARANSVFSKQFAAFFSMIDSLRLPSRVLREVSFTTRRLFHRAPWLGKTSPGLVWTTPGLVWRPIRISPQIFYCPFRTPTRHACIPHGTQPFFRPKRRPNHCAVLPEAFLWCQSLKKRLMT